ncbi:MAG TPA: hypothetical protein PKE05_04845 [Microthrixaceae bacterium]|nr:hypothetical protein [Microthrixaceae bacterium]
MDTPDLPAEARSSADGRRRVQPGEFDSDFLRRELDKVESLSAAQKVQRLAENDIILTLQLQQFSTETDEWRELAAALLEYGYAVFLAWTVTGQVRGMAARHGRGGVWGIERLPERLRLPEDQAHDLVMDLLLVSVDRFRVRTLMAGRWSAIGGASLTTFFVGRCLMELPDVYEQWDRKQVRTFGLRGDGVHVDDGRFSTNPAEPAIDAATLDDIFDGGANTDEEVRAMFELQHCGYSLTEIAEMLSAAGHQATEASVRTRMSRARSDAARRRARDA